MKARVAFSPRTLEEPMKTVAFTAPSAKLRWAGRSISAVAILFMLFDTVSHLVVPAPVADAFKELGFPVNLSLYLGLLEAILIVLYVVPQTAILGSILLTGYLGGAVAIQLRVGHPIFQLVFPAIVGTLLWAGVLVRDAEIRALMPLRSKTGKPR
jgi:hypothetical protein